jgi:transposase
MSPVPEETVRIARAAVPKGTISVQMRDVLGAIYTDEQFVDLFAPRGRPVVPPWRLALVSVMQFAEGLSDRQAAEAVRVRIDWKYALGLELEDPGFDYSVLSEFRTRLAQGSAEERLLEILLEILLDACTSRGLLKARGRQRTDGTHVLGVLRVLSRLERVAETLRAALNALATEDPAWVQQRVPERAGRTAYEGDHVVRDATVHAGRLGQGKRLGDSPVEAEDRGVDRELHHRARPERPEMEDRLRDRLERRTRPIKILGLAPDHERQRAGLGQHHAAAHRRVEQPGTGRPHRVGEGVPVGGRQAVEEREHAGARSDATAEVGVEADGALGEGGHPPGRQRRFLERRLSRGGPRV